MNYTPFGSLTNNELLLEVWNKEDASDLELELAERLDYLIEYVATLEEESESGPARKPQPKYKEAA